MRVRAHRFIPVVVGVLVVMVLMVVGCSDGDTAGDAVLSASAPPPTDGSTTTVAAPTTARQASSSTTEPAVDQAALREAIAEVEGLGELGPAEVSCLSSHLAGDDGVLEALQRRLTFEALGPELQERVLLMAVGCAPVAVAESVVDGIEVDLDDDARACIVDQMAGDDDFLVTLVQVVLATSQADPDTTAIPLAAIGGLETLMATCDIPLTALPE